jgi:hypothetical protein
MIFRVPWKVVNFLISFPRKTLLLGADWLTLTYYTEVVCDFLKTKTENKETGQLTFMQAYK